MKQQVSIIIPCYNSVRTLEEAVESCYTQGLDSFEIVIVDDGSNDGTRELIKKLASERKFISYVFHEKNRGGGAARNTATKHAKSDLIYCLDSDNVLAPDTLSKMYAFQKKLGCDGVGIHRSIKFRNTNKEDIERIDIFSYENEKIPFVSLLQENGVLCPLYATFLIKKEAHNSIGGYPEHHGFDTQGMAWRFLSRGLVAYTCPDTQEFHRVDFTQSYYLREAHAGRVNYNWQDIFFEHFCLFDHSTQEFIRSFDCRNFTKNIFEELKKQHKIFKDNFSELLGYPCQHIPIQQKRIYIKRDSPLGIKYRIVARLRSLLKKYDPLRRAGIRIFTLSSNIIKLRSERAQKREYYTAIEAIKHENKIIVDLQYGGLGDCLVYTALPRLLAEAYGTAFYLTEKSCSVFRHPDIFKLCFESNPFFKGFSKNWNSLHIQNIRFRFINKNFSDR